MKNGKMTTGKWRRIVECGSALGQTLLLAPKRLAKCGVCAALAFGACLAQPDGASAAQHTAPAPQSKWPAPYPYPIGAGLQGLASGSTAVVVADVLETNPCKAIEGARDNVKLKVVRVLMGRPVPGDTLDLYYHLLWVDNFKTLEPPKFEKGKRYIVFLRSHYLVDSDRSTKMEYELSDQWLSVIPRRANQCGDQLREIVAAIRTAHGDARGAWSQAVGPLQARLVAYHNAAVNGSPIISVYLDLNNVSGGDNTVLFDLAGAAITWEVTDENGTAVAPAAPPATSPR